MTLSNNDIQVYSTCDDPMGQEQKPYSQSIGGYASPFLLYPKTTLSQNAGLYSTVLNLNTLTNPSEWEDVAYLSSNGEIMKVNGTVSTTTNVEARGFNNLVRMHLSGDDIYGIKNNFFNYSLNDNYKQYRCLAIVNNSISDTAYNVTIGTKQIGTNQNVKISMAIERPNSQYISGTSTDITTMTLTDTSLNEPYAVTYPDNYFRNAYLTVNGSSRKIASFDSETSTFSFTKSIDLPGSTTVPYSVSPGPCQRLISGLYRPITNNNMSDFLLLTNTSNISIGGGGKIEAKNVIYVWLERFVKKGSTALLNNNIVINIKYTLTE